MSAFEEYRRRFFMLYHAVKRLHESSARPHQGHGLDHDVTVAMLGARISPDDRTAEKVFCAGLTHSVDRIVASTEVASTLARCLNQLPSQHFTPEEVEEIYLAVIRHENPQEDDSLLQQVLMDAERLAGVMLSATLRAAQWLSDKPVVEFRYLDGARNPATTWSGPRSALDGARVNYQLLHPLRTPKGLELAERYVAAISSFVSAVEEQYRELGLVGIDL